MALERGFPADGPVGRYWLANCIGFRVRGPHGIPAGVVDEIALGADGVDELAIRRRGVFRRGVTLVPVQRVTTVDPWDETVVLAPRPRARAAPAVSAAAFARQRQSVARSGQAVAQRLDAGARRLGPPARASGAATRRGVGVAAVAAAAVLVAGARIVRAFLLRLVATARAHAPHVRGYLLALVRAVPVLARAYVDEGRRALREQRQAFVVWRESRREPRRERADAPDVHAPLTRARAADVWVRTRAREYLRR